MKLTARLGTVAVVVTMAAGLLSAPASAVPHPPSTRIRPAQLPVGAAPRAAWVDPSARLIHTSNGGTVALPDEVGKATNIGRAWRVHGGWLVTYYGAGSREPILLVRDDGSSRALGTGSPRIVARGGLWFVREQSTYDSDRKLVTHVLRQVRARDGRVLATKRITTSLFVDVSLLQASDGKVLVELQDTPSSARKPFRYTTMWWTPKTGKTAVLWRRAQPQLDAGNPYPFAADVASTTKRWVSVREGRRAQAIRDLRTHRLLWTLPKGEHAVAGSPNGSVLMTATRPLGGTDVQALRARSARTGRLLSTYRTISGGLGIRAWESSRTFVFEAATRIDAEARPHGSALVRCTVGTVRCQRVDALTGTSFVVRQDENGWG